MTKKLLSTGTTYQKKLANGEELVEKKITSVFSLESGELSFEIQCHYRQIGSRMITTTFQNGLKEDKTVMSAEEKEQFDQDWEANWIGLVADERN